MKRMILAGVTLVLVAAVMAPATAITEEDLRDARIELQDALGELDTALWDQRIASDNAGFMQFEYDEMAEYAAEVEAEYNAMMGAAASRALVLFNGPRDGTWSERAAARVYLEAAIAADSLALATKLEEVTDVAGSLEYLAGEIEFFTEADAEASVRIETLQEEVAQLDAAYNELAAAYEAEVQYNATTTTTTTLPPTTTTTSPPPVTTTTTVATGTTTTLVGGSTTTTVPVSTTTTTTPPLSVDGLVCPVQGPHHFRDTWGAPRSGGRTHQGVDMMADRGTPLVAIESGTVGRLRDGGLGGITLWFYGDSGNDYYYAHLDAWAPGLAQGQYLTAGAPVGTVGSTGNASDAYPHLHFEIHPGGGSAINPFPTVDRICP